MPLALARAPLLESYGDARARLCESPARWAVLICVSVMPCGVHMCYKMTSGIQTHLMHDAFEPSISALDYGMLNSAVSWFNLVVPFFAGPLVDRRSTRYVAVGALLVGLLGQLIFTLGVHTQLFYVAVAGRSVFGLGEGAVMIAQGAAIAQWFCGAELTFAVAITETGHSIANWLGKIAVVIALELGGWWITLWIGVVLCAVGVVAGCVFGVIERRYERSNSAAFQKSATASCASFTQLTMSLWVLLVIHLLVSNTEHIFDSISANFMKEKFHETTSNAAWLSSLNYACAILLCPLLCMVIDKTTWRMVLAMCACCLTGTAHLLLGLTNLPPAIALLALSLPQSIMPTILRASAPLVVSPSVFGMAYGAYGIAESLGKTIGSPAVGYITDLDGDYLHVELGFATASFTAAALVLFLSISDKRLSSGCGVGKQTLLANDATRGYIDIT